MSRRQDEVTIEEIVVAADPARWSSAGFLVDAGRGCRVGSVGLRLAGDEAGRGIVGWSLRGLTSEASLDGLPATVSTSPPVETARPADHPNGALAVDHVVAFTPDLDRTVAALERAGLELRRIREQPLPGGGTRQAFFRLGEPILELIDQPAADGSPADPAKPARLWGLAFVVEDLEQTAARLGDRLGEVRDAVQPGRRIATVRRSAALGAPVAFMSRAP